MHQDVDTHLRFGFAVFARKLCEFETLGPN
jgi:hypothetical protein